MSQVQLPPAAVEQLVGYVETQNTLLKEQAEILSTIAGVVDKMQADMKEIIQCNSELAVGLRGEVE